LRWIGVETQVFNVGNYRRERIGAQQPFDFFDSANVQGARARLHMAIAALDDMLNFMKEDGVVAIYDATNSTRERRSMILKRCEQENVQVVFVESICTDPALVEKNIRETKLTSPEYVEEIILISNTTSKLFLTFAVTQTKIQSKPLKILEREFKFTNVNIKRLTKVTLRYVNTIIFIILMWFSVCEADQRWQANYYQQH
jgi:hypothetical protein